MEEQTKDLQDYIVAIRKRKTAIFAIFSVILLIMVFIAYLLPAIYKSSSTILIEQQEIPPELVMSTVTSYAAERIQTIQARAMTRTNLLKIIEKFDLYKDDRKYKTTEEVISSMRDDVSLDVVNAEVIDPRTGRPSSATIAFSLSYKSESPIKAQRVANELTSLYLSENLTSRAQKASETSNFFKEEAERLGKKIDLLESKLAMFKQQHANALPELQTLNLSVLQRKETELTALDAKLGTLEERQFYISGQLDQIDPGDPSVPGSVERLKSLQAEYASVRSKYSDDHPDVLRLKNEIASLEKETGPSNSADVIAEKLKVLTGELEQKAQTYTAEHPDIVGLKEKISVLTTKLEELTSDSVVDNYYDQEADNPIYITLQSQLATIRSEIKSTKKQREQVTDKISELEKTLYEAPQVEREYLILRRDYQNAIQRYQETKTKQMQAEVAQQLELESKGERFTLIEPAILPEKPISPNRPAIIFLGFLLALGSALGFAIIADVISGTVHGANGVCRTLGAFPLSVIPFEMNLDDKMRTKRIKKRIVILFVLIVLFAFIFIHFFISPLDVLWFRVLRKIDILLA